MVLAPVFFTPGFHVVLSFCYSGFKVEGVYLGRGIKLKMKGVRHRVFVPPWVENIKLCLFRW